MHPRTRELHDYLDRQRTVLREALLAVPAHLRNRPAQPDRWSAAGVIEHLAMVETRLAAGLAARVEAARASGVGPDVDASPILPTLGVDRVLDRTTKFSAPDAIQPTGLDADAAWAALECAGQRVRDALDAGDGLALDKAFMPHPRFGEKSLYYFFAFVGAHEARHAAQLREIAADCRRSTGD